MNANDLELTIDKESTGLHHFEVSSEIQRVVFLSVSRLTCMCQSTKIQPKAAITDRWSVYFTYKNKGTGEEGTQGVTTYDPRAMHEET